MRFRLGLLQDTAAIERQIAKDAAEAKKPHTVKTEAQTKADEAKAKEPEKKPKIKIRPLSEAKAIELGANFVSESFLLGVGIALVLFENARRQRREVRKDDDVTDKLEEMTRNFKAARTGMVELEKEIIRLRGKDSILGAHNRRILPKELREIEEEEGNETANQAPGWLSWISNPFRRANPQPQAPESVAAQTPQDAKEAKGSRPVNGSSTTPTTLSKILPQFHAHDHEPKTANYTANGNSANTADPPPKEASPKAS